MFSVDIMMLYISVSDHARKLKFSSYAHLPSINKMFQNSYVWVILCNVGEISIFMDGCYILGLEYIRMFILAVTFF